MIQASRFKLSHTHAHSYGGRQALCFFSPQTNGGMEAPWIWFTSSLLLASVTEASTGTILSLYSTSPEPCFLV